MCSAVFPLCAYTPGTSLHLQISCSYKDISQTELGSTMITSLNLTTPSKAPSPSAGHVCLPCASGLLSWEVTTVCRCCYWDESLLQRGLTNSLPQDPHVAKWSQVYILFYQILGVWNVVSLLFSQGHQTSP